MRRFVFLTAVLLAATAAATTEPGVAFEPGIELDWSDPTFQKQFLGTYGSVSDVEPRVNQIEAKELEKLLGLMGKDTSAAAAQLEAVTTPESSAVFDFTLGNLYFQQDRLDDAAARYREAIRKFPTFRRAYKNLGLIEVRVSHCDGALRALTRVVELGGNDALTYGLLGHCYGITGRFVSAESAYRTALLLQPEVVDWKLGLAQSILRQRKYGEAAALCDEILTQYPDRADLWLLQAGAFVGLNQPLKAAENYEVVRRMGKATAQSLDALGDIYVNEKLWDMAEGAYADAIRRDPGRSVDRPIRTIAILAERGALSQAKALLTEVNETYEGRLDEADRKKLLKLGARIAVAEGSGGDAAKVLEEIVAIDPLDGEALLLLGQHYTRAGEPDRAVFYYERAASIDVFEADAKVRQAQVLVSQSRFAEAVPLLKRAQEIKPREDVARYLEQVEKVSRSRR